MSSRIIDHSKSGVGRIGPRFVGGRSMPPTAANRAWMAWPRFFGALGLADNLPQDIARLFLHRPAMLGGAHTQAALYIIVEIANRYAGHGTLRLQCQS